MEIAAVVWAYKVFWKSPAQVGAHSAETLWSWSRFLSTEMTWRGPQSLRGFQLCFPKVSADTWVACSLVWGKVPKSIYLFLLIDLTRTERERQTDRERETGQEIPCSTHLCIHWFSDGKILTRDWSWHFGVLGQGSTQWETQPGLTNPYFAKQYQGLWWWWFQDNKAGIENISLRHTSKLC